MFSKLIVVFVSLLVVGGNASVIARGENVDNSAIDNAPAVDGDAVLKPDISDANLLICLDTQVNTCQSFTITSGACVNLSFTFNKRTGGFLPPPGYECHLFESFSCSGIQSPPIDFPNYPNLGTIGWVNRASSYQCNLVA